ncbi:MAG: hypothetical protein JNM27_18420 [Leptospirales bacterium]|nr:hypothetical protein [Leptospirales bacterium]
MHETGKDYAELLTAFGEDRVRDRFAYILSKAKSFIAHLEKQEPQCTGCFKASAAIVEDLVLDYYADIRRLKDFHLIERTHPTKVAAYTAYWTARRKPIQTLIDPPDAVLTEWQNVKYVNEAFAALLLVGMVYDNNRPIADADRRPYNLFRDHLIYFLIFRAVNPQALELVLLALDAQPTRERIRA